MTPTTIRALVRTHIEQALDEAEQSRAERSPKTLEYHDEQHGNAHDLWIEGYEVEESRFAEALYCNDLSVVEPLADSLITQAGMQVDRSAGAYLRLCRELLKASVKVARINLARELGDYTDDSCPEGKATTNNGSDRLNMTQPVPPVGPAGVGGLLFSQAVQTYFAHYNDRDKLTIKDKEMVFARFIDILGGDRLMQSITKPDLIRFRDTFSRFPSRLPDRYRGKSAADLLACLSKLKSGYPMVGRATVNADLTDLRHLFSWALKHDYYDGKNPVDGIAYEGVKHESYEAFTDEDLSAIFTGQQFISQRTGNHPERYWLIFLLAYSGARREEIAQMLVTDIREDKDGVWFLDILPDAVRETTVKNEASKRRTPLHSRLIDIGFLSYVDQVRRKHGDKSLLFPIPKKVKGRLTVGDAVGKWYNPYRQSVGVKGKKPLHSFRHTVVTRLIGAGVAQDKVKMLVGHTDKSVTGGIYTDRQMIPLTLLRDCLEKLHYPSLGRDHPS